MTAADHAQIQSDTLPDDALFGRIEQNTLILGSGDSLTGEVALGAGRYFLYSQQDLDALEALPLQIAYEIAVFR